MNRDQVKSMLLEKIDYKRKEMIETAIREGYSSEETVKCSQDLDILLNKYQQLEKEKTERTIGAIYEFVQSIKIWAPKECLNCN